MSDSSTGQGRVQVRFVTNAPDIELPEGKKQLLVPTGKEEKEWYKRRSC